MTGLDIKKMFTKRTAKRRKKSNKESFEKDPLGTWYPNFVHSRHFTMKISLSHAYSNLVYLIGVLNHHELPDGVPILEGLEYKFGDFNQVINPEVKQNETYEGDDITDIVADYNSRLKNFEDQQSVEDFIGEIEQDERLDLDVGDVPVEQINEGLDRVYGLLENLVRHYNAVPGGHVKDSLLPVAEVAFKYKDGNFEIVHGKLDKKLLAREIVRTNRQNYSCNPVLY